MVYLQGNLFLLPLGSLRSGLESLQVLDNALQSLDFLLKSRHHLGLDLGIQCTVLGSVTLLVVLISQLTVEDNTLGAVSQSKVEGLLHDPAVVVAECVAIGGGEGSVELGGGVVQVVTQTLDGEVETTIKER